MGKVNNDLSWWVLRQINWPEQQSAEMRSWLTFLICQTVGSLCRRCFANVTGSHCEIGGEVSNGINSVKINAYFVLLDPCVAWICSFIWWWQTHLVVMAVRLNSWTNRTSHPCVNICHMKSGFTAMSGHWLVSCEALLA